MIKFKMLTIRQTKNNIIEKLKEIRSQVVEAKISNNKEIDEMLNDLSPMPENGQNIYSIHVNQSYLISTKN